MKLIQKLCRRLISFYKKKHGQSFETEGEEFINQYHKRQKRAKPLFVAVIQQV